MSAFCLKDSKNKKSTFFRARLQKGDIFGGFLNFMLQES